jgi:hypothetical protein
LYVGRAVAALAQDPKMLTRTGQLWSSWELSRDYRFTDDDGRRPDWGARKTIDFSMFPPSFLEMFRIGLELQAMWLKRLGERTARTLRQLPRQASENRTQRSAGKRKPRKSMRASRVKSRR